MRCAELEKIGTVAGVALVVELESIFLLLCPTLLRLCVSLLQHHDCSLHSLNIDDRLLFIRLELSLFLFAHLGSFGQTLFVGFHFSSCRLNLRCQLLGAALAGSNVSVKLLHPSFALGHAGLFLSVVPIAPALEFLVHCLVLLGIRSSLILHIMQQLQNAFDGRQRRISHVCFQGLHECLARLARHSGGNETWQSDLHGVRKADS
mmetsp:Transcript_18163/g.43691  ORF Transcript_18163/g.43691 Transcript_18163/m.43691 type:complete len:205 (+) Transcript_18163:1585-2199(+)